MTNPTQAQIDKLTTNLGRWDDIVNGSETDTVTLDNSTVKTVSGYLAELKAYNSLGAWQTAYSYAVKDVVLESSILYVCLVAHTSGTFATDLASGKWAILQTDYQNLNVSGTFSGTFTGDLTGDVTGDVTGNLTGTATNSTHVFVVDNEAENENNLIPFIEDATATGNVGLESDGDFYYNPSTGTLTATLFEGTLSTASQTNITSLGVLTNLDVSGNIRMPYSTSKYIIGVEQVASNTFRTTFDSIEINGADAIAGGSAMGGGSVIIRGGGAQGNSSTNSYGGHVKIYGGELLGGSTGAGQIYLYTNNTQRMIVNSSGLITGDFNDISDISLKKNVRDFERTGLEIVKDIQPRLFDWIEEEKGNNIYGFIAQELEEVMPTAIIQEDVKSINVTSIVSVLVQSVQELKKELDALKNK